MNATATVSRSPVRARTLGRLAVCAVALLCWTSAGHAADPRTDATNKGLVELETGGSADVSLHVAEDLAHLVDDGATRRVLPVVGRTAMQTVYDLVLLRGIDMAILQTDVLETLRQDHSFPGIETRLSYVTKLYNEEFHLLALAERKNLADLAQQTVDVGPRGSGTAVTAERLFALLKVPVTLVYDDPDVALEKLRHGDVAAIALVAGKPSRFFRNLPKDDHLHFISVPLAADIISSYVPTSLSSDDYPSLIAKDQTIDTVSVGSVLAVAKLVPASDRYRNVSNFVDVFFTQFHTLLEPGHAAAWQDVNLAAELPGWTRFPAAQQWLDRNAASPQQSAPDVKEQFSTFLNTRKQVLGGTPLSEQQKQDLFNQFQLWQAGKIR